MQVVGYETEVADGGPALLVAEGGSVRRQRLTPGDELGFGLGERRCAGTIAGDAHVACDSPRAPFCERHTDTWACARCRGDCDKPEPTCDDEHAIYLAAFAPDVFKVGVTRRGPTVRLREQGADRGAHIRTVPDGRIARQIEADIATEVGDRVRVPVKVEGLHRRVDEDAWRELLEDYDPIETYDLEYDFDLSGQPVQETLLTGTVLGTKGRVLLLDAGGTTYAVDMRSLVGYEIEEGPVGRDRQVSLGSFAGE